MVNAYNIANDGLASRINDQGGIHDFLRYGGVLLMDSGGFQFRKRRAVNVQPDSILEIFRMTKPDVGIVLDHPLDPGTTEDTYEQRWKLTLKNTRTMMARRGKVRIMPTVHGYDFGNLEKACRQLSAVCRPRSVALGSLVPLLRCVRRNGGMSDIGAARFIGAAVRIVRRMFPTSWLHVLGVGGTTTMHTFFALGADSVDSISWRLKAAYGAIQLPGTGDRFVSPKVGRRGLDKGDFRRLESCTCPTCQDGRLSSRLRHLDNAQKHTFQARAIHNAYVFQQEASRFREYLHKSRELELVRPNYKLSSMVLKGDERTH